MITAEQKIDRSIDYIFKEFPFFSLICDDWRIREAPEVPTAGTDGPNLVFNRKFIDELSQDDCNTLILHEAGHIFLGHHLRFEGRPATEWNVAADLALNWHIMRHFNQSGDLRKIALFPGEREFVNYPTGRDAEYYFKNLPKNLKQSAAQTLMDMIKEAMKNGGQGLGPVKDGSTIRGTIGVVMPHPSTGKDGKGGTDIERQMAKDKWERQVIGGIETAKGCGKEPGFIDEVAKTLYDHDSTIDWKHLLRRFLHKNMKIRYSYQRPNRRSSWRKDIALPARFSKEATEGIFLVDTSGSMAVDEMNRALREMEKVLVAYPGSKITMRQADTQLQKTEYTFTRWDFPMKVPQTWSGRGGTELAAPITEAAKAGRFNWMVIITDMIWSYQQAKDPGMPVFWLQTKGLHEDVPFGVAIECKE